MKNGKKIFDNIIKICSSAILLFGVSYILIVLIAPSLVIPPYGDDGTNFLIAGALVLYGLFSVYFSFKGYTKVSFVLILLLIIRFSISHILGV